MKIRAIFAALGLLAVAGCATQAQRQYADLTSRAREVTARYQACNDALRMQPGPGSIMAKLPRSPTLDQLTDQSFATPDEVRAIRDLQSGSLACRAIRQEFLDTVSPRMAEISRLAGATEDQIYADLIVRRASWGDASSRYRDAINQSVSQSQNEGRSITDRLDQQHNAEIAQQAAAANAIAAGLQAQQAAMQRQQMINSMNRPVTTNCMRIGSSVNCTSF